jgi:hypothetical protein
MKNILYLLILIFSSCTENISESDKKIVNQKSDLKFETLKHINKGIILSSKVNLYDQSKNPIGEIDSVFGQIVQIENISKSKFDLGKSNERCNLHNFVQVKSDKINGWIYGESIFELENANRDTSFVIDNVKFKIFPTKNFGIGVYDEEQDGLSFCEKGTQSPVIIYNGKFKKEEFIPIEGNQKAYNEGYFTLDNHDGWKDKITNANYQNDTLRLTILREFQEGFADIELDINFNDNQSIGRVIKEIKRD